MLRIHVQSHSGNVALAVIGGIYVLAALAVLTWFVIDVRGAAAMLDRLMQVGLVGAALCGVWFIVNALDNLGIHWHHRSSTAH